MEWPPDLDTFYPLWWTLVANGCAADTEPYDLRDRWNYDLTGQQNHEAIPGFRRAEAACALAGQRPSFFWLVS
jgi:hypothetical protein